MSEVTRYSKPYPQTTDEGDCPATGTSIAQGRGWNWCCTRVAGHADDHQAGGPGGVMYASWPAEEVAS